jgi:hypothetical protein
MSALIAFKDRILENEGTTIGRGTDAVREPIAFPAST